MNREEYQKSKYYFTKENCPFCSPNLPETNEIFARTEFFTIIFNKYPYFDEPWVNLLVFPNRHIEFTSDFFPEEMADFVEVEKILKKFYEEKGLEYFSFIRQSKSNKSVEHLHYHYLPGCIWSQKICNEKILKIKNSPF